MYKKIITLNRNISKSKSDVFINFLYFLITIMLVVIIILIITNPQRYTTSTINGLKLFFYSVFPTLFPFFVISNILTSIGSINKLSNRLNKVTNKIFHAPGEASYVFIMSMLCGYPVGARIIEDYYDKKIITEKEAKKILPLSSSSGIIFIIGVMGSVILKDIKLAFLIYLSHIISIVITALIFRGKNCNFEKNTPKNMKNHDKIIKNSINSAITSMLTVAAYITIFYIFIDILFDIKFLSTISYITSKILNIFKINTEISSPIASGLVELTRGIYEISNTKISDIYKLVVCTFLTTFGGLSIIMQSYSFLSTAKIKMQTLIILKFAQSLISIFVSLFIGIIFI